MPARTIISVLATSMLAGEPGIDQLIARAGRTLGRQWPWIEPMVERYVSVFAGRARPRHREVVHFLLHDDGFRQAWLKPTGHLFIDDWLAEPHQMQPVPDAGAWDVPPIESIGALAQWLGLETGELDWFADLKGLGAKKSPTMLMHYHYQLQSKRSGAIRLIEAPKPRLKELQRVILHKILEKIPSHDAAHGFVKGRSIQTFIAPHTGKRVVLRMDLRDFFPSFAGVKIQAFFRTAGYPESVADLLGGICTNVTPRDVWKQPVLNVDRLLLREARVFYSRPHLPQGAPSSPALSNLCAYRADCRLAALAKSAGCAYTRYADDLAFSGGDEFDLRVKRFAVHAAAILREEGFQAHDRKTRIMRQGLRQHLVGLVANEHPNIIRADFDRLKAILTNCVRHGPESQNRDAHPRFREHLQGRVGFVESINPTKGKRLRSIFEQIRWID